MATISTQSLNQLVKINLEQSGIVELRKAFLNFTQDNSAHLNFYPMSPQIDVLKTLGESAVSGGSALLVGSVGTGKSSIMLLLSEILSAPYPSDTFSSICNLISDVHMARSLAALRKPEKRWLIVIPEANFTDDFDSAMRRALNGALFGQGADDFVPAASNLIDEFSATCEYIATSDKFDGMVVLCDGADKLIKNIVDNPQTPVAQQVKEFSKFCSDSKVPVLFVSALDREISKLSIEEENILLDTFQKIQPVTLLSKIGEWEELVGKVLISHSDDENWQSVVNYKDFRAVVESLSRIGLYQGSSDKWINDVVMQGAYPIHPATLFALPRVALCLGAKTRTAFSFFSESGPGGLTYFLRNFAVVQPNGRLHLYTADSLYTYFEKIIQNDENNAVYVDALQKAILMAGDIPQARRILRMILVFQMVGHDRLRTKAEELIWALHLGDRETQIVRHSLQLLVQKSALQYVESTGEYLLPIERKKVNLEEALYRVRNRVRTQLDLRAEVQQSLWRTRYDAGKNNSLTKPDRSAFTKVYMVGDLKDSALFMKNLKNSILQVRPYRGDIQLAFAVPESQEELDALAEAVIEGKFTNPRLVMMLPHKAPSFSKDLLEVKALERLRVLEPSFNDPVTPEYAKVTELYDAAKKSLAESIATLVDVKAVDFYYQGNLYNYQNVDEVSDWVETILADLIGDYPKFTLPSLAYLRDTGHARKQRQSLISYLIRCRKELAIRSDMKDSLDIVNECLVDKGILHQVSSSGYWIHFDLSHDIPDNAVARAFKFIVNSVIGGPGEERKTDAVSIVMPLLEAPYSLTPSALEILLSAVIWKNPRSLKLLKNKQRAVFQGREDLLEETPATAEAIFDLVGNPSDWVFSYSDCSQFQKVYLDGILHTLGKECTEKDSTLWEYTFAQLEAWFNTLPVIAAQLPLTKIDKTASQVRTALKNAALYGDARNFLEKEFPVALGAPPIFSWPGEAEELCRKFASCHQLLSNLLENTSANLTSEMAKVLGAFKGGDEGLPWNKRAFAWLKSVNFTDGKRWKAEREALVASCQKECPEALSAFLDSLCYPEVSQWRSDFTEEILERLSSMREDVEWSSFSQPFAIVSPEKSALGQIVSVLGTESWDGLESFLVNELQWASWPESMSQELEPVQEAHEVKTEDWLVSDIPSQDLAPQDDLSVPPLVNSGDMLLEDAPLPDIGADIAPELSQEPISILKVLQSDIPEAENTENEAKSESEEKEAIENLALDEPTLQWL